MCVICVSDKGVEQPTEKQIRKMFLNNSHGAGYMVLRDNRIEIRKGFMTVEDLLSALQREKFTAMDPVIYHFRLATRAGISREMCQPFPLTGILKNTRMTDLYASAGVAHNGTIYLSFKSNDEEYSDTAHFIVEYLWDLLKHPKDLKDYRKLDLIWDLTKNKFAIMDRTGYIATIGEFVKEENGLLFSNCSYR